MSQRNINDMAQAENDPEEIIGSGEEGSERTRSSYSSMTHPYRALLYDTSFARCHVTQTPGGKCETYTRSMYMLGNGTALWEPIGDMFIEGRPPKPGLQIGDVGFLTQEGEFEYYFNIFQPPTASTQRMCPPDMEPLLPPPEPSDVVTNTLQFPPGTTLTTIGVEVSQLSSSPLDIKFTVKAREGSILILPNGATREDLVSTPRVRDYVRRHALQWYIFVNNVFGGRIACPNGCLYLVTGYDKTDSWALTCGPLAYDRTGGDLNVRYQANKTPVWQRSQRMACKSSKTTDTVKTRALFLRGMKIAVNVGDWTKYILRNELPEIPFYNVMATPVLGRSARYQTLKERSQGFPERYLPQRTNFIFHPLEIILRYLLDESPTSDVAIVEESAWCTVADQCDGSLSQVTRLLVKILEKHELLSQDGLVTLKAAALDDSQDTPSNGLRQMLLRIPYLLKQRYQDRRRRSDISRKIGKIFPGAPVPNEQLQHEP